jgi:hypothetical protein
MSLVPDVDGRRNEVDAPAETALLYALRNDLLVRFATPPGRQMQVDWGGFRLKGQRISLFLPTLAW